MRFPTIYTSPSERPKFDFLQTSNYLSEFKSEVDKARVRENKSGEMYFLFNGRTHYFHNFIKVNDNPWIS